MPPKTDQRVQLSPRDAEILVGQYTKGEDQGEFGRVLDSCCSAVADAVGRHHEHRDVLVRLARDKDDLAQDLCAALLRRKPEQLVTALSSRCYLWRCAVNRVRDYKRELRRRPTTVSACEADLENRVQASADEIVEYRDLRSRCISLARNPHAADVIDGVTARAIARRDGLELKNAEKHRTRARRELREIALRIPSLCGAE